MQINATRLHQYLADLATIGQIPDGGVCRLAFTPADLAGRTFVVAQMLRLGLDVRIDAVGNVLGVRPGRKTGPVVLTGSHTDSVKTGGRFDGSLGVLAGLEVIATLNDAGLETELPIGVISFVNEEGVRFMPDMMGSLYQVGALSLAQVRAVKGTDGTTIGDNLDALQYAGADDFRTLDIAHFIELHIEQGPWLERQGITIGAVERVQGICWLACTYSGVANHAGATPMSMRQDAGYAAAALAHAVRAIATAMGPTQRATTGTIKLFPNLINVIAETGVITVDLRNPDASALETAVRRVREEASRIAREEGVTLEIETLAEVAPVTFDEGTVRAIENASKTLGYSCQRMISGAAHDAQILARRYPAAMIFVPSRDGISHNVREFTRAEDVEAGANVLLHAIVQLANAG